MADCLKCGGPGEIPFRVLEVHTLHVRDLAGEKWVQALGDFREYAVCGSCTKAFLERVRRPGAALGKKLLPYLAVLAFGVTASVIFWTGELALRLPGAAGIFCSVVGMLSVLQKANREKRAYAALPTEEALGKAAWNCLLEAAPKKAGDNDLTYIPVDPATLSLDCGALGNAYDLLPMVAKQAWGRLHGTETPTEAP